MWVVRVSARSTHCPGASSLAAVRNMEQNRTMNIGFISSRNICPMEIPDAARSVGGNFIPMQSATTAAAGIRIRANFVCQPTPARLKPKPVKPPPIRPPGHQACSEFSFAVFSSGYSVAASGLITVSTNPQPMPVTIAPP